jgi:hypothetical protein
MSSDDDDDVIVYFDDDALTLILGHPRLIYDATTNNSNY